jgi:hypothetical protein
MVYVRPDWAQSVVPGVRGSLAICNAPEDIVRRGDERGCCGRRLLKIRVVDGEMRAIVRRLQKAVTVAGCSAILCPTFRALIYCLYTILLEQDLSPSCRRSGVGFQADTNDNSRPYIIFIFILYWY